MINEYPIPVDTPANANFTSTSFIVGVEAVGKKYKSFSFQFVVDGLNASDGVIKLEDSNDGVNWNTITADGDEASITTASGSASYMIRCIDAFVSNYVRAVWTKGTNSAGTIKAIVNFKD